MRWTLRNNDTAMWTMSGLIALAFMAMPTMAQNDDWGDYEYETDQGLHEEEWYDPSDWFDTDTGVDYELDYDPYYTDYDYYDPYDPYYGYNTSYDRYDYDPYRYDWYAVYYQHNDQNRQSNQDQARSDRRKRNQPNRDRYTQNNRRDRRGQSRHQNQMRSARFGHHFNGDLVKTQTITMFGDQHVLAKIRKSNGKTCIVDLGPKKKISKLNLEKGDTLRIDGRRGMLAAGRVVANDETVTVDRQWAGDRGMHPYRTKGRIDNLRTRMVDGKKKLIAYLEGPDGWLQRVNLGSKKHLKKDGFKIEEGDHIKVRGHRGHVGGTAMVFANRIKMLGQNQQSRWQSGQQQRFSGEVMNTWTEQQDGDRQMFVTVELQSGKAVDVSLGEKDELERLDIAQGDEIRIRGKKQRDKNGKACVVASSIRVNGGSWQSLD